MKPLPSTDRVPRFERGRQDSPFWWHRFCRFDGTIVYELYASSAQLGDATVLVQRRTFGPSVFAVERDHVAARVWEARQQLRADRRLCQRTLFGADGAPEKFAV